MSDDLALLRKSLMDVSLMLIAMREDPQECTQKNLDVPIKTLEAAIDLAEMQESELRNSRIVMARVQRKHLEKEQLQ